MGTLIQWQSIIYAQVRYVCGPLITKKCSSKGGSDEVMD